MDACTRGTGAWYDEVNVSGPASLHAGDCSAATARCWCRPRGGVLPVKQCTVQLLSPSSRPHPFTSLQYYNFQSPANGSLVPSKAVGHFTQLVWDRTTHVGCGVKQCPGSSAGDADMTLVVW